MMNPLNNRTNRIMQRINELSLISDDRSCINRIFGTKAFVVGQQKVLEWMKAAGLETRIDHIGNVRGRCTSKKPGAKTLVIASHFDTVVNAGKFDGPLGVILGIELADKLIKDQTETIPFHIEIIGFSDEEGVRFHTTYLGSKVVAGKFNKELLTKKDAEGISLEEAIRTIGGNPALLNMDAIAQEEWLGYFEVHIEQGPVLYENKIPVAIVTAIAGQIRVEMVFKGFAGHAGTVPMNMRQDALVAAAGCILGIEQYANNKEQIVATVGKLNIPNSASNVIPGEVVLSLDLRSANAIELAVANKEIKRICEDICKERNIELEWNTIQQTGAVHCSDNLNNLLADSIKESGYEVVKLVSGAGHDAAAVSEVSPVSMLFVRCYKGISHNPLEDAEHKDIEAALKVSDLFLQQLIKFYN